MMTDLAPGTMFLNDVDPHFLKSINYFYGSDSIMPGDTLPLQIFLEEAIKIKNGASKDLSGIVSSNFNYRRVGEYKPFITVEESKTSNSDNELEMDLLKEDLMCIICNGMDVGARNRLLECSDCHSLYHQECHKPIVTNQDSFDGWVCQNCNDARVKAAPPPPSVVAPPAPASGKVSPLETVPAKPSVSISKSHRHNYKSSSSTSSKTSKSSSSSSGKTSSSKSTSGGSRSTVTPNINIISADKRIQIMKKKAAKLQEKRKHSTR